MNVGPTLEATTPTWLSRSRFLALAGFVALVAVVLRWPATQVGLMSDDFMQLGMLQGIYPGEGYAPFDLYAFLRRGPTMLEHIEQGTAPWWSVPELHGTVLRPVASVLLWLDHSLLPGRVVAWHLHSMLWFVLAIFALALVLERLFPRQLALVAVLLFACEAGMVSPLAWLANRCALVCFALGLLALWVHIEWRRPRETSAKLLRTHGGPMVLVLMSLCICAGEYGLGILAYLLAWELFAGPGPARERGRALAWAIVPVLAYLAVHKALGYGTFGAEVYADPFHSPSGYFGWLGKRLPKLITAAFWSVPGATIHVFRFGYSKRIGELWVSEDTPSDDYHAAHLRFAMAGVVLALVCLALARRAWSERERVGVRVVLVGGLLGLLPIAIAPAHSRLLIVAQLATCSVVSASLLACLRLLLGRAKARNESPRARMGVRARGLALFPFACLLTYAHGLGDLRWGQAYIEHLDELQAANLQTFYQGDLLDQQLAGRDVVILNAPSQSVGLFGEFVLASQDWPAPSTWRPLSLGGEFPMLATRLSEDTLELTAIQGAWMHTAGELFFRREDQRMHAGDQLRFPSLAVDIHADVDGHPTSVRFRFPSSLDDPRWLFVIATREGLRRWPVPGIGQRRPVPLPLLPEVEDPSALRFPPPPGPGRP